MREVEIYIDGASKGNPGPSGIGVVISKDGEILKNISHYIGEATNNIAEYTALIYGLKASLMMKADRLKINTDSQLLHRQMRRLYKIKNPNIMRLYIQVTHLLSAFKEVKVNYIPREQNRGADKLATQAIKEALKKK